MAHPLECAPCGSCPSCPLQVYWCDAAVGWVRVSRLMNYQRINHFPGLEVLALKSNMSTILNRLQKVFPREYNFSPRSWNLPMHAEQFRAHCASPRGEGKTWIFKPSGGSFGRGIVITKDPLDWTDSFYNSVVQEYIANPLLLEGKKFDMRVYVLVCTPRPASCDCRAI